MQDTWRKANIGTSLEKMTNFQLLLFIIMDLSEWGIFSGDPFTFSEIPLTYCGVIRPEKFHYLISLMAL